MTNRKTGRKEVNKPIRRPSLILYKQISFYIEEKKYNFNEPAPIKFLCECKNLNGYCVVKKGFKYEDMSKI